MPKKSKSLCQIGLYSAKIMDHYNRPRNVGSFGRNAKDVYTGLVGKTSCGDVIKLELKITKNGVIKNSKFKAFGCASSIAASSLVTEWLKNKTVDEALQIKNAEVAEYLSLTPIKIHCSVLIEEAIHAAINAFKNKQEKR